MKIKGFSLLNLRRTRVGKNKKKRGMLRQIYSFTRIKLQQSVRNFSLLQNSLQFSSIFENNSLLVTFPNKNLKLCSIFEQINSLQAKFQALNPTEKFLFFSPHDGESTS